MSETSSESRIACDVDFERDGKQVSRLRVPWSRNSSAWGSVQVPICCVKNGEGPTVLFTAGAHGDEYEGPLALSRLARELQPGEIRGRVIVLPGMNVPALRAATRLCPVDGRDLNRVFPGDPRGTYAPMMAHFVATQLVPRADLVVDMHSGGTSLWFTPCVIVHHLPDADMRRRSLDALRAFGAPLGMVLRELDSHGELDTFVEERGTLFLTTELAGGSQVTPDAVRVGYQGAWNVLAHAGVLPRNHPRAGNQGTGRLVEVPNHDCYTLAPEDGVFEPFVTLGDEVQRGQPVGQLVFLNDLGKPPVELRAAHPGTVVCKRSPGLTEGGDTLLVVAEDYAG